MRIYFVYLRVRHIEEKPEYRIRATQDWKQLDGIDRQTIPHIWKVQDCYGSEDAKSKVLLYYAMPINRSKEVVQIR